LLTNYVYKLRPNHTQDLKMSNWVDLLRSHYNWCLNDRIIQYNQQFVLRDYCELRNKAVRTGKNQLKKSDYYIKKSAIGVKHINGKSLAK
jgi:transposase